jgi:hypothetical protein
MICINFIYLRRSPFSILPLNVLQSFRPVA